MVIYSLLLIVLMITRPQGLLGTRELICPALAPDPRRPRPRDPAGAAAPGPGDRAAEPILALDHVTMPVRRAKAVDDLTLDVERGRAGRADRPERRGQDHRVQPDHRRLRAHRGHDPLRRPRRSTGQAPYRIAAAGIARTFQNIAALRLADAASTTCASPAIQHAHAAARRRRPAHAPRSSGDEAEIAARRRATCSRCSGSRTSRGRRRRRPALRRAAPARDRARAGDGAQAAPARRAGRRA